MADYPILAATLAALNGTKNDPTDAEASSKLAAVDRQTRNWLYDFLSVYIDASTGKFKSTGFGVGLSLPASVIRGTNGVDGTAREIAQGSIRGADIADASIPGSKITAATVNGDRLTDNTVTGAKLTDGSVTSAKLAAEVFTATNIAAGAVTTAKIAAGAVTSDQLGGGAVTSAKLGNRSVTGPALPVGTEGQLLVGGNGPASDQFAPKSLSGALTIDKNGLVRISQGLAGNTVSFVRIAEQASTGSNGGSSVNGWNTRGGGAAHPWAVIHATRQFVEVIQERITFLEPGKYWVAVTSPMRGAVNSKVALIYFPNPGVLSLPEVYYGLSADSTANVTTNSTLEAVLNVSEEQTRLSPKPFFYITHYSSAAIANVGLGQPTSATVPITVTPAIPTPPELYAQVTILRIQETVSFDADNT